MKVDFFRTITAIVEADVSPISKAAMICLLNYRNSKTGACYPAIATISEGVGAGVTAIKTALTELKEKELVSWESKVPKYGNAKVNHYSLLFIWSLNGYISDQTPDQTGNGHEPTEPIKPKEPKKKASPKALKEEIEYPEWLNQELFNGFIQDRKDRRCPATPKAIKGLITALDKACNGKYELQGVIIEKSITNSWKSFFALRPDEIPIIEEEAPQFEMHWDNIEKASAKCAAIRARREAGEII